MCCWRPCDWGLTFNVTDMQATVATIPVKPRAVRKGKKKDLRNTNRNEYSWGRSMLHGTFSTSKVGGWWLAVGGGWRLAAVGSGWQLAVGAWWCMGAVLKGCPSQRKKSGFSRTTPARPDLLAPAHGQVVLRSGCLGRPLMVLQCHLHPVRSPGIC